MLAQLLRLSHAKYAFNKIKIEKKNQVIGKIPRTFQRLHVFPDRILPSWGKFRDYMKSLVTHILCNIYNVVWQVSTSRLIYSEKQESP